MTQSRGRRDALREVTVRYGLAVVGERHHVPAVTLERAVLQIPVRRWLGPTATPVTVRRAASDNGEELRSRRPAAIVWSGCLLGLDHRGAYLYFPPEARFRSR
jgi:hypothetical protein